MQNVNQGVGVRNFRKHDQRDVAAEEALEVLPDDEDDRRVERRDAEPLRLGG